MKGLATQARNSRKRGQLATSSVQRKAAIRISQSDSHERQAEQRGVMFARGQTGLSHGLSSVPAAGFVLPTSVGEPLPSELRASLETAFDAQFAAVRIHRDAPASRAAERQHANAFTSGTHIYFNANRFRPDLPAGRELLAHEIAHVLQQTARAGSSRVQATEIQGNADVQREWRSPLTSTASIPEIDQILLTHRNALTSGSAEYGLIDTLLRQYTAENAQNSAAGIAYWATRAAHVLSDQTDPVLGSTPNNSHIAVASALYDALKASSQTGAAARLLKDRSDLTTTFFSAETYQQYAESLGTNIASLIQRVYADWYGSSWFGTTGSPRFMLDLTLMTLLSPTVRNIAYHRVSAGILLDVVDAELNRRNNGQLGPNELHYITVNVALELEAIRHTTLTRVRDEVARLAGVSERNLSDIKLSWARTLLNNVNRSLRERAQTYAATTGPTPSVRMARETLNIWFDDFAPALRDMAQYAIDFWAGVSLFSQSLNDNAAMTGLGITAASQLSQIETVIPGYKQQLTDFIRAILARRSDGSLHDPATFVSQRDAAVSMLDREVRLLVERPLADRLIDALSSSRAGRQAFEFSATRAAAALPPATRALYAWALHTATDLRHMARTGYSASEDAAMIARQRSVDPHAMATDLRDFFRIRFSRKVFTIALLAGWDDWQTLVRPILTAQEIRGVGDSGAPITGDYVAFRGDWALHEGVSITRMEEDIPTSPRGFEPLHTRDLVNFFVAEEYFAVSEEINTVLGNTAWTYGLTAEPVINTAMHNARARFRPQRYVIPEWEWITPWFIRNGRNQRDPRTELRVLLRQHPLTTGLINRLVSTHTNVAWSVNIGEHQGRRVPVLWAMPTPFYIIDSLKEIPEVNALVIEGIPTLIRVMSSPQAGSFLGDNLQPLQLPTLPSHLSLATLTQDQLMNLDTLVWWNVWRAILAVYQGAQRSGLLRRLRSAMLAAHLPQDLRTQRQQAYQQVLLDQRTALTHERRRRIETQWRPALEAFESRSFNRYRIPGTRDRIIERLLAEEIATRIQSFVVLFDNREESRAQTAMALLELADTINAKLGSERQMSNIIPWVRMLDESLIWANGPGANATLRNTYTVPNEHGNTTLFEQRRTHLQNVMDHMATRLREQYREWGVVGVAGDNTLENTGHAHPVGNTHRTVGRNQPFTIDGVNWEILQVHTNFTFHPGTPALRSMQTRSIGGSILKIGNGPELADDQRPSVPLMQISINAGDPIDLMANNPEHTELLTNLTWAVHQHAILEQLGDLAAVIETFGSVMMDAAELFPGAGQALAAARLLTTALEFATSDLPGMVADLVTNPRETLENMLGRLTSMMQTENLLGYLIFSDSNFEGFIRAPRGATRSSVARGSTSLTLQRLLRKLHSLMRSVGRVFARVHGNVQDRRQQLEQMVQGSPWAVRLVQIIGDYYLLIATLADYASEFAADRDAALAEFNPASLSDNLNNMINALGELELPEEILPLEDLINVLIDVIGHRLGGKYKLGVRILLQLLDYIGARQRVVNALANELRRADVTTETVLPMWEEQVIPAIRRYLQDAQSAIRNTLNDTFNAFEAPLNLAEPRPQINLSGTEFTAEGPEAQPSLTGDIHSQISEQAGGYLGQAQAGELLQNIASSGGEPLPQTMLDEARVRFSQDFSHVRLHRGSNASRLTEAIGAFALTSGSHVVLGGGVPIDRGSRVLYHELAHVVQQTGVQTPDRRTLPLPGRPGRGLVWNATDETQADTLATTAMRGDTRHMAGIRHPGSRIDAWQPAMIELLGQRFLRQMVDVSSIREEVEDIDRTQTGTGRRLIGRDVRHAVSHVARNLNSVFRPGSSGLHTTKRTYQNKLNIISEHLLNTRTRTDISEAIEDIAIRSSWEAEPARGRQPARMALNIHEFTRRLERYILGKTGIMLELNAAQRGHGRRATFRHPNNPYQSAEVKFVFLADVHGNSRLWREALQYRTVVGGARGAIIPEADRATLRRQIRAILHDLGPSTSIWLSNDYRFSHRIFSAAEELASLQQRGGIGGILAPGDLPSVDHYINTTGTDASGVNGNIRLHLGTYSQKTSGEQSGRERESHHITQYLLVEYFHNGKQNYAETNQRRAGFPLLNKDLAAYGPDMHLTGSGKPDRFTDIKIDELDQDRGGKMPTILLARPTHRRGNLHVSPSADDFTDAGVSTQAGAINHIYKNALPREQRDLERRVANDERPYSEWETYRSRHNIRQPIINAMQTTYRYMRNYMQPQLRTALKTIERDYYNDIYASQHPSSSTEPLTRDHMNQVWNRAVRHNDVGDSSRNIKGLSDYGWRV
ncbi:eCIS core domain-containing protein [Desulfocastanea catecholica]